MATGFGAIPIRHVSGGQVRTNRYYVPSTDGTAIYKGDFVGKVAAVDPKGECGVVKSLGGDGDAPIGVVVGFEPHPDDLYKPGDYRAASTSRYVLVCDDPNAVFAIQEDAAGGVVAAADVAAGFNADITRTAGSTVTGISGMLLDSSTAAATSAVLKIIGVVNDGTNAAAQSGGAMLEVMIYEHALYTTDSIT